MLGPQYRYFEPKVDLELMAEPRLVGHLTASGGTGNDVEVLVMTETEFVNWKNGHETETLFNSGQTTAIDLDLPLEKTGQYYLVISNLFSGITPKTVAGTVDLKWQLTEAQKTAAAASNTASVVLIGLILLAVAALGGWLAWFVANRKRKAQNLGA